LVDYNNYHLYKPMLHEVATGSVGAKHIAQPIHKILEGNGFKFIRGVVQDIDFKKKLVKVCHDCNDCEVLDQCTLERFNLSREDIAPHRRNLEYDYLVISLGGSPNFYGIEGSKEFSLPLNDLKDSTEINRRILEAFQIANCVADREKRKGLLTFAVVGAGPTGVETVSDLHDWIYGVLLDEFTNIGPDDVKIHLIEAGKDILPLSPKETRKATEQKISEKKIEVLTGSPVVRVGKDELTLKDSQIETFATIWTAGVRGNALISKLDIKKDPWDRIIVDEFLEVGGAEGVFALGDCSLQKLHGFEHPLPQTGQVAVQQAKFLVAHLSRKIDNAERIPFSFRELGSAVSIGKYSAIGNIFGVFQLSGLVGWIFWKFLYFKHLMGIKRSLRGTLDWFHDVSYDREASRHKFSK
ncbi:MAG: NAD(P)/FAD-dependent oxidoreductase, partial [Candidatus Hydrothermarchaeaceae archaeon]